MVSALGERATSTVLEFPLEEKKKKGRRGKDDDLPGTDQKAKRVGETQEERREVIRDFGKEGKKGRVRNPTQTKRDKSFSFILAKKQRRPPPD